MTSTDTQGKLLTLYRSMGYADEDCRMKNKKGELDEIMGIVGTIIAF